MKRMIKYGSIDQFRQIVKAMQYYDNPTANVELTEKIHGTNASVCFSEQDGFWVQSKNNIITPESDNAGCAAFCYERERVFVDMIRDIADDRDINLMEQIVTLYFEWAGGSIQKNSALSGFDKRAVLFSHFKVSGLVEEVSDDGLVTNAEWYYLPRYYFSEESSIYHIQHHSKTWSAEVDFEAPAKIQNEFIELVAEIEKASPMGQHFGKSDNVGEGMVGTFFYKGRLFRFKVKGEKHSASKVKTLSPVCEETEAKINDFVMHALPGWRLDQGWQETFGIENEKREPTVKATGDFLRWIHQDIMKEEMDVLEDLGLTQKQVNAKISTVARKWFMIELDKDAGLS